MIGSRERIGAGRLLAFACTLAIAGQLCLPGGASANSFPANAGLGGIPDGAGPGPGAFGASRDVIIPVSGLASGAPTRVAVTLAVNHTRVGDLDVVLQAPT